MCTRHVELLAEVLTFLVEHNNMASTVEKCKASQMLEKKNNAVDFPASENLSQVLPRLIERFAVVDGDHIDEVRAPMLPIMCGLEFLLSVSTFSALVDIITPFMRVESWMVFQGKTPSAPD